MKLILAELMEPFHERGIYGKSGNILPKRFRFLHPAAAESLREIEREHPGVFRFSDMLRSANGSRRARQKTRHAQRPGFSAHNYGLAVDQDVPGNLRRLGADKKTLDTIWREHGWFCHRRDHRNAIEAWHFNYLGDALRWMPHASRASTASAIEAKLQSLYGDQMRVLSIVAQQTALTRLGLYCEDIDGLLGPYTTASVRAFQRAWLLTPDGICGRRTQRTLAYVTASREVEVAL